MSTTDANLDLEDQKAKEAYFTASQTQLIWSRFKKNRSALIAGTILMFFVLVGVFAPFVAPYQPTKEGFNPDYRDGPPQAVYFWDEDGLSWPYVATFEKKRDKNFRVVYKPNYEKKRYVQFFVKGWEYSVIDTYVDLPGKALDGRLKLLTFDRHLFGVDKGFIHLFGTDRQKKDLFSRTVFAVRVSLAIGALGVVLSFVLALIIGGIAGYFGGWIDRIVQMITDSVRVVPTIPLFMAVAAFLPDEWSAEMRFFFISLILGLLGWPTLARRIRTHILAERTADYVLAAQLCGASPSHIIRRHLLPSFTSYIIVDLVISFPYVVLSETALSFIGLGLKDPVNSLGVLLQNVTNVDVMLNYQWYFIPVPIFVMIVLAFVFVGDGLRDAADPYSERK
ncbi:ABC transporter permease [Coralliovum pocilloporae]|uniref:ABC transporter permease n=1 Tax=Coralliovum pocilloporae TaxID=3066369 RepID=UPI003307B4A3